MIRILTGMVALLALMLAPLAALDALIDPSLWLGTTTIALVTAATLLTLMRLVTRWIVWPTIIAGLGALGAVVVREAPLPPGEGLGRRIASLSLEAAVTLRVEAPPVSAGEGIGLIVAGTAVLLFIAAEATAIGAESPAIAGLPALFMWAPQVATGTGAPTWLLLISIGSYIALLSVDRLGREGAGPLVPVIVAVTALSLGAAMILTPWALSRPSWVGNVTAGVGTRLDLGLDIRSDLTRGADIPLIHYRGLGPGELGPLHSHTLQDFDGQRWHEAEEPEWVPTAVLHPEAYKAMVDEDAPEKRVEIQIDSLSQDRLFLPEAPRELMTPEAYDPIGDEVLAEPGGPAAYLLSGRPRISDPDLWRERSLQPREPVETDSLLDLPDTSHRAQIEALADEITEGARSPYEKAVAIQQFFRSDSRFSYTTSVPTPQSDDAVWDFLEDGRGYCVQFATGMVVLARAAGIPARMAVGFLPGQEVAVDGGGRGGVISSHDAHTWPQLFLGEAGWVRFEPTPSERSGRAPEHSRGFSADPAPEEAAEESPSEDAPEPSDPAPPDPSPSGVPSTDSPAPAGSGTARIGIIIALVLAGAAGLGAWTARRARRGSSPAPWGAQEYWEQAVGSLRPSGLVVEPGDTPLSVLTRARELPTLQDAPNRLAALEELTRALNASRYAPHPRAVSTPQLQAWLEEVERDHSPV